MWSTIREMSLEPTLATTEMIEHRLKRADEPIDIR